MGPATIGLLFLGLALVFLVVTIRDYRRTGGGPSPARRAWLRIAIIFGLVGAMLQLVRLI
jgi:hypothetical protein